jgi:hypothetical protein
LALFERAGNDHIEHLSVKSLDAAQIEDAAFPKCFERITEYAEFPFGRRIGCVEDQCRFGF